MKKRTAAVLIIILVAGIVLYSTYLNQNQKPSANATSTTLAELLQPTGETTFVSTQLQTQEPSQTPTQSLAQTTQTFTVPPAVLTSAASQPASIYAYAKVYNNVFNPRVTTFRADEPYLICVSSEFSLPEGYSKNVVTKVCVPDLSPGEQREMEQFAADNYRNMYNEGLKAGVNLLTYSGYRSTSHQKTNFDNKIEAVRTNAATKMTREEAITAASRSILPPGCSEHETGLAMDIARLGHWTTDANFDQSKEFEWLTAHAHEYGFILRYPKDKVEQTGVKYEPWHWRFVGIGPATEIRNKGECLEEYLVRMKLPPFFPD